MSLLSFNHWKDSRDIDKHLIRSVICKYWDKYNGVFSLEKISKFILIEYNSKLLGSCYTGYIVDLILELNYRKKSGLLLE